MAVIGFSMILCLVLLVWSTHSQNTEVPHSNSNYLPSYYSQTCKLNLVQFIFACFMHLLIHIHYSSNQYLLPDQSFAECRQPLPAVCSMGSGTPCMSWLAYNSTWMRLAQLLWRVGCLHICRYFSAEMYSINIIQNVSQKLFIVCSVSTLNDNHNV